MRKYFYHLFADEYDGGAYCDFSQAAAQAIAGKDILLAIWNDDGTKLLAVAGQRGLTINRSADTIEVTTKDTEGGWKASLAGAKEWSISNDGIFVLGSDSHKALGAAFNGGNPICVKVYDMKHKKGLFAGLACVTEYTVEAPYDDAMTYSINLVGMGQLHDLTAETINPDKEPEI